MGLGWVCEVFDSSGKRREERERERRGGKNMKCESVCLCLYVSLCSFHVFFSPLSNKSEIRCLELDKK